MKFSKAILFLLIGFCAVSLFALLTHAQSPSPSAALQTATNAVSNVAGKIPSAIPASLLALLGLLGSELVAHAIPTTKPVSWFLGIGALMGAVIGLLQKVQNLCVTLGNSLQNISSGS